MKKWGIIGGTFDPIHNGHIYIAEEAQKQLNLDKVIFMVAGNPPHKLDNKITDANLRLMMVESAIKHNKKLEASDYEIKKQGVSFTYLTLEEFKKENIELYFITGADCLVNIESWRNIKTIFNLSHFVVFTRPGFEDLDLIKQKKYIEEKYNTKIIFLQLKKVDVSSTEIRRKIKDGESIKNLIPKDVLKIINEEKLYRS